VCSCCAMNGSKEVALSTSIRKHKLSQPSGTRAAEPGSLCKSRVQPVQGKLLWIWPGRYRSLLPLTPANLPSRVPLCAFANIVEGNAARANDDDDVLQDVLVFALCSAQLSSFLFGSVQNKLKSTRKTGQELQCSAKDRMPPPADCFTW